MKTKLPLLLCALFIALTVNAQTADDPDQWQRYTVAGAAFSVKLPARPVLTASQVWFPPLKQKRWEKMLLTTANAVHYAVYAYENPGKQQSLDDFITEQTAQNQAKLEAKRSFELRGTAGREYTWLDRNKFKIEQFFATQNHLYRFRIEGASAEDAAAKQFFSSIVLGENPEGITISDGPGLNGEKIYTAKEVDKKARMTRLFPPEYTDEARKRQITGVVYLKVVVSSTGEVTGISVVSGLPFGLTEMAIAAARKIKFTPAVKDGKNVAMWMQLEYNFNRY